MDKEILKLTIIEQRKLFDKEIDVIRREIPKKFIETNKISVLSGIRRSGKSTILKQIAKDCKEYGYLNFEDERLLNFKSEDFNLLYQIFLELYNEPKTFFFDEIQNVYGWEKFARRLFEEGHKIFVTGSNAKLLSTELATTLTGRHMKIEVYPFSFKEYLTLKKVDIKDFYDTKEKSVINRHFNIFIEKGGFPEIAISGNLDELKQLYQDVIIKDLIVRFKIKDQKAFRELVLYLISNTSKNMSFNNLKRILNFKSTTTVKNYVDFLEESYLIFSLSMFDYSIKKQIINDRKIYSIDTGITNAISFQFSKNTGRHLENAVFIELKRRGKEIYYHKKAKECDFLLKEGTKITSAIQVTEDLTNNKKREIDGLLEAIKTYNLKYGLILTEDLEDSFKVDNLKIIVKPVWKWLLETEKMH